MRKNLLEFLYGEAVYSEASADLGEQVVKLFEEAADEENRRDGRQQNTAGVCAENPRHYQHD